MPVFVLIAREESRARKEGEGEVDGAASGGRAAADSSDVPSNSVARANVKIRQGRLWGTATGLPLPSFDCIYLGCRFRKSSAPLVDSKKKVNVP